MNPPVSARNDSSSAAYIAPFLRRYRLVIAIDLAFCLLHLPLAVLAAVQLIRTPTGSQVMFLGFSLVIHGVIFALGLLTNRKMLRGDFSFATLAYINAAVSPLGRIGAFGLVVHLQAMDVLETMTNPEIMGAPFIVLLPVLGFNAFYASAAHLLAKWTRILGCITEANDKS